MGEFMGEELLAVGGLELKRLVLKDHVLADCVCNSIDGLG